MNDQVKNVETFQSELTQLDKDLVEAKKLTDETLQKAKAETALLKAETLATKIQKAKEEASTKLKALESKTDATSKAEATKLEAEIKEYEDMLAALTSSKMERTTLKTGVTTTPEKDADTSKDNEEDKTKKEKEETDKDKSRLKKQRDGVTSKEEWKTNTGANVLRVASGIGIVALGVRGIKKLFGIGKKNKEKEEGEKKEKKGFRETGFGKFLKWAGIGTGAYYLIHGFVTGKRGFGDFFDRKKKPGYESNDPETFDKLYEDHSKEEKEQYDALGTAVNEFFSVVYGSVKGESGSDMLGEQTGEDKFEKHTGTMPCALDETTKNVGDILDGTSDFNKKLDDFGSKVSKDIGKQINPLNRFSGSGASAEELAKLDKETVRKYQVYRKTLKVQVFLHQKEKVLVRRLVAEKLGITDYATASEELKKTYDKKIDTAMEDDDTMEAINTKMKSIYYNQKLTGVMEVLKKYNISNDEMVEETKKAIKEVDQDKNDLIGDTLDKATASADINTDETLKEDVSNMCTEFDAKINDEDDQMVDFDNFFIGLGDAWLNMEVGDKQKILKEIGYTDKIAAYSTKVAVIKKKIADGRATKADMVELKKTIDDYYIFKKDIVLGVSFVHEADDKNTGLGRTLMYIGGKLIAVLERAWDKGGIVGVTIAAFVMRQAGNAIVKGGSKLTLTAGKNRIRGLGKDPGRLLPGRRLYRFIKGNNRPAKTLRMQAYNGSKGYDLFQRRWKNGKMTMSEAQQILDYHGSKRETELKVQNLTIDNMLEKGGYIRSKTDNLANRKLIAEYFDTSKSFRKALKSDNRTKVLSNLEKYDTKLKALNKAGETKKVKFMEDVFGYMKFKNGDELVGLINNIDSIDVSVLEDTQITDLAKKIGRKITAASTVDDIAKHIDEIKKAVTNTVDVLDDRKVKTLTKMIDDKIDVMKNMMGPEGSPNRSKVRRSYYTDSIESLEKLKTKAKTLSDIEYNAILKFTTHGFEVDDIAKLYKLKAVNGLENIEDLIKKGDISELTKFLDDAAGEAKYAKYMVDIKAISSKLDIFGKTALKAGDDAAELLKGMIKIFTKLT